MWKKLIGNKEGKVGSAAAFNLAHLDFKSIHSLQNNSLKAQTVVVEG